METSHIIIGIVVACIFLYYYYTSQREGWRPRKSFYNSGLPCDEFCAKIKKEDLCTRFNMKENTKCLNTKGMPVVADCYMHKKKCMSMV